MFLSKNQRRKQIFTPNRKATAYCIFLQEVYSKVAHAACRSERRALTDPLTTFKLESGGPVVFLHTAEDIRPSPSLRATRHVTLPQVLGGSRPVFGNNALSPDQRKKGIVLPVFHVYNI